MSWIATGMAVFSAAKELYDSKRQGDRASKLMKGADPFRKERPKYIQQLSSLMADPSQVLNDPIFQGALDLGMQGVSRKMASQGFLGSGNEATALLDYGQKSALGYLSSQTEFLARLGGANIGPATGAGVAAWGQGQNTQQDAFQQFGAIGGLFGGDSVSAPTYDWGAIGGSINIPNVDVTSDMPSGGFVVPGG